MPTLNIEGDDNHFIIKNRTYDKKYQSWQVTDGAIQFLKQNGIQIPRIPGDKVTFDQHLLTKMISCRLVYTKGEQHQSEVDEEELNAEQRLDLVFREKVGSNGWELAVAARKVPTAWRSRGITGERQNCKIRICDPYTSHNRTQRVLKSWTLDDILANKPCTIEPITGRYIVEAQGHWPSGYSVHKWIHNFRGMDVDGTLFHDSTHGGWRLASHEVIHPGRSYYFVAPFGKKIPKEIAPRLLRKLFAESPYPSLRTWEAWSITIPQTYHEVTYGRLQEWFGQIGHSLRELPWRLALISPPPIYYTSEGIPVLEQGQDVIIEVLPPTDHIQGAESTEIQVKRDAVPYLPRTSVIRSHCFLTFPLHQPGKYLISGLDGLTRPLNVTVIAKDQKFDFASPQALNVTVRVKGNVYQLNAFEHGSSIPGEHIVDVDMRDETSLPQINVLCPIPLDLMWFGVQDSEYHWQSAEPTSITACIKDILLAAWKKRETVSLSLDAGAFGKLTLKVVMKEKVIQRSQPREDFADKNNMASSANKDVPQLRLQWLLKELESQKGQGLLTSIPATIRKRLSRLQSIPECVVLLQRHSRVPLHLLPHIVAITTLLERERQVSSTLDR